VTNLLLLPTPNHHRQMYLDRARTTSQASGQPSPALAEPAPASAPAPAPTYNSDFVVDDYALDDDGTAI
jgi:hypothetical protein